MQCGATRSDIRTTIRLPDIESLSYKGPRWTSPSSSGIGKLFYRCSDITNIWLLGEKKEILSKRHTRFKVRTVSHLRPVLLLSSLIAIPARPRFSWLSFNFQHCRSDLEDGDCRRLLLLMMRCTRSVYMKKCRSNAGTPGRLDITTNIKRNSLHTRTF